MREEKKYTTTSLRLKPYNVEVEQKFRDEPFERMLKRFLKKVKKHGIIEEFLAHRVFTKPSIIRHLKNKNKKRLQELKRKEQRENL